MDHTFRIEANVPENRRIQIELPDDIATGTVEITMSISSKGEQHSTGSDLLASEIFGMWADREDIGDSAEFARNQRDRAWKRSA